MRCPGCGVQEGAAHLEGCYCLGCRQPKAVCSGCFRGSKNVRDEQFIKAVAASTPAIAEALRYSQDAASAMAGIGLVRAHIGQLSACRERSLALTKLDECELWLSRSLDPRPEFAND
jgi:hypothetical protein